MSIIFATSGTMGDHLPMMSLASKIAQSGIDVTVACNKKMHPLAHSFNLKAVELGKDLDSADALQNSSNWDFWSNNMAETELSEVRKKRAIKLAHQLIDLLKKDDLLVGTANIPFMSTIAQASSCEYVEVGLNPASLIDTRHPSMSKKFPICEDVYFKKTRKELLGEKFDALVNVEEPSPLLHLQAVPSDFVPAWYPLRPAVNTGFWFCKLPSFKNDLPDQKIIDSIKLSPRPLALAFSSQPLQNPVLVLKQHLKLAELMERKLIVVKGWSFGEEAQKVYPELLRLLKNPRIIPVDPCPLEWIFEKVDIAFVHGGIGTLAEALKAPCLVVIEPYGNDQLLNACIALKKGLALVVHPHKLEPDKLSQVLNQELSNKANCRYCPSTNGLDNAAHEILDLIS